MNVKHFIKQGVAMLLLFVATATFASTDPVSVLQGIAKQMVTQLDSKQSQLKNNPAVVREIVDSSLMPYIDTNRMAGMVVGRSHWYAATPDQRREFVKQFKQVVIATYSDALASYNDDKVKVYPLRESAAGKKYVNVSSAIIRKSGQKIAINYNLINKNDHWKIYDFSIEGVSIVQNYRSQFANTLAKGGMESLITQLTGYNRGR